MREEKVLINDLEINYKIAGEGKPLLILHGWGGSSGSWIEVQKKLAEEGYKVICPDFPGFGKSKTPPKPWGIGDYVNWVGDFANLFKLSKFPIIGHSFGGRIAVRFAVKFPKRIENLILCDSAGIKVKPGFKTRIIFWIAKLGNMFFTPKPLRRFKDGARNGFYVFLRNKDYAKAKGVMKETIKKVLDEDLLPDLSKIKTKTLIIWGGIDKMIPVKYAQIFKENIRNSKLEILPKIGHSPHLEVPGKLSEIIIQFLEF